MTFLSHFFIGALIALSAIFVDLADYSYAVIFGVLAVVFTIIDSANRIIEAIKKR